MSTPAAPPPCRAGVVALGMLALFPATARAATTDDCSWRITAQQLAKALLGQNDPDAQRRLRILQDAGCTGDGPPSRCGSGGTGGDTSGNHVVDDGAFPPTLQIDYVRVSRT